MLLSRSSSRGVRHNWVFTVGLILMMTFCCICCYYIGTVVRSLLVVNNRSGSVTQIPFNNAAEVPEDSNSRERIIRDLKFALISAHNGKGYDVMASLGSETKARYAELYGYAFFSDSDMLTDKMSFNQKSASRIQAFRRHWEYFDWLIWLDSDILITNANISLNSIILRHAPPGSGVHVILSKDWNGRQVNPAVTFVRTSAEGLAFVERWDKEILEARNHDDLLAIRDGMERKRVPELKYVKWVPQREINPYAHLTLTHPPFDKSGPEHNKQHALWQEGDFLVHIVNCLRQWHLIDAPCCNGIAAWYYSHFMNTLRDVQLEQLAFMRESNLKAHDRLRIIDEYRSSETHSTKIYGPTNWTLAFSTTLNLHNSLAL
mmetsp:Transcript_2073/g.3663  ORF Transcript_2073/g.3663 Transcript_2073/m.3663 type:complete len:375 (-) Transcript_2073:378-1502(-)